MLLNTLLALHRRRPFLWFERFNCPVLLIVLGFALPIRLCSVPRLLALLFAARRGGAKSPPRSGAMTRGTDALFIPSSSSLSNSCSWLAQ